MPRRGGRGRGVARAYKFLEQLGEGYRRVDAGGKKAVVLRIAAGHMGSKAARISVSPTAFDMVQTRFEPMSKTTLTAKLVKIMPAKNFSRLRLVEVKSTAKAKDRTLRGHFFSFVYQEQLAAQALGARYRIVFVGVNPDLKVPFKRELRWDQLWTMARSVHISFSIQFR